MLKSVPRSGTHKFYILIFEFYIDVQLLGVRIDNLTLEESLEKISGFLNDDQQYYIVTPNHDFLVLAQKDEEFCEILNKAGLSLPDGIGIVWAAKFLGRPLKERVAGIDLVEKLKDRNENLKIFLLGGEGGVAKKIASNWKAVVGYTEDKDKAVDLINQTKPNLLLVALGAPKQEKWIAQNLTLVPSVKVAIGVGGAFNFLSGKIRRAPKWLQKLGLEWLWRTLYERGRWIKFWRSVVVFPILVLKEKFKL